VSVEERVRLGTESEETMSTRALQTTGEGGEMSLSGVICWPTDPVCTLPTPLCNQGVSKYTHPSATQALAARFLLPLPVCVLPTPQPSQLFSCSFL
jgi:hypothetical protein